MSFAVPTNQVMVDYPFMEGWVADGTVRPDITLRGVDGATKQQRPSRADLAAARRLFVNVYYQLDTTPVHRAGRHGPGQPGAWASTVPVDRVTAWLDTDSDSVVGEAPAGAPIRVFPSTDRGLARRGDRRRTAATAPATPSRRSRTTCAETRQDVRLPPRRLGRAYLTHADNNEVFAVYGRAMHVNQNENYVELYQFVDCATSTGTTRPQRTATVTLTPRQPGSRAPSRPEADAGRPGKTKIYLLDGQGQNGA